MKCHHPDVFCAAILNAQPMGFYQPAQLVSDAQEHGVEVRPVCINRSRWDARMEANSSPCKRGGGPCEAWWRGPTSPQRHRR